MPEFYTDAQNRYTDGIYAKTGFLPVSLPTLREVVSNDIPALGGTPAFGNLGKDTTPNLEFTNGDTDSAIRLEWAASNSDAVTFQMPLPPDFDTNDPLYVKFTAQMGGTTDSLVVASDAFFMKGDTKVEDNSGTVSGTVVADYTITIAAADIPAGARTVSIELTPGAHTTDTLELYALWAEYTKL